MADDGLSHWINPTEIWIRNPNTNDPDATKNYPYQETVSANAHALRHKLFLTPGSFFPELIISLIAGITKKEWHSLTCLLKAVVNVCMFTW